MTTRPTDEEIEEMADELAIGTVGMTKSDRQTIRKASVMFRAILTERQAARDEVNEIWHKAINAWLPAMRHGTKEQADKIAIDIIQSVAQPVMVPDAYTIPAVSKTVTVCSCGKSWEAGSAPDCACRNTQPQPQQAVPDDGIIVDPHLLEKAHEIIKFDNQWRAVEMLSHIVRNVEEYQDQLKAILSAAPAYNGKKEG